MNAKPYPNIEELRAKHESLGNRYLDLCKLYGIKHPPLVAWATGCDGTTSCIILLDSDEDEVVIKSTRHEELPVLAVRSLLDRISRN